MKISSDSRLACSTWGRQDQDCPYTIGIAPTPVGSLDLVFSAGRAMKTILVPIEYNAEQNAPMVSALETALLLARKFESCIEGFPLRPAVADMLAMDPDAGLTMVAVKENDAEMVRQAESLFRSFMETHDVPRRAEGAGTASLSWTWLPAAPSGHAIVGSYGGDIQHHG